MSMECGGHWRPLIVNMTLESKIKVNYNLYLHILLQFITRTSLSYYDVERQPENPEFKNNPENFHQCL